MVAEIVDVQRLIFNIKFEAERYFLEVLTYFLYAA